MIEKIIYSLAVIFVNFSFYYFTFFKSRLWKKVIIILISHISFFAISSIDYENNFFIKKYTFFLLTISWILFVINGFVSFVMDQFIESSKKIKVNAWADNFRKRYFSFINNIFRVANFLLANSIQLYLIWYNNYLIEIFNPGSV